MVELAEGDIAPDFSLPESGGRTRSLRDLRGKNVVLYFYPKDDTSGCTKEACGFRDEYPDFSGSDAIVLGVSPDEVRAHDKFASKYGLPFPLLADVDHRVSESYGAWGQKSLYGRKYMGILRNTYLIGPDGRIRKIWRNVKPKDHAAEVLRALRA
ncbi:MAG TPA: thioredoxin-dependent thiol peroxidase [Chloroflexota bacterium]